MASHYIDQLNNFDWDSFPDLDVAVLGALELFTKQPPPAIDTTQLQRPLVVGSGNAEATGRILFTGSDAVLASESTLETKLSNISAIDGVVLITASGDKHAPGIVATAHNHSQPVTLITNTPDSPAGQLLDPETDQAYVLPKNREPYTYNTSTYMGMILGHTREDPAGVLDFIHAQVQALDWPELGAFSKYYLIVPPQFSEMIRMLQVKFIELFGRRLARDIETSEYVRHATTVVPSEELFISFGEENRTWGEPHQRFFVPLPDDADYGAMMAVGYYVVSQIQAAHPDYFKEHIADYTGQLSELFGETIEPIVEGS